MWLCTTDRQNTIGFLFESPERDHEQYMTATPTGSARGKNYEIGPEPTQVPDVVGGYALANVEGVEQCAKPVPAAATTRRSTRSKAAAATAKE